MTIFTCEDSLTGILTCIYDAWASGLGHKNIRLMLDPVIQPELFCNYCPIFPDVEKAASVSHSIQTKISPAAWKMVCHAAMSCDPLKADHIYRFLLYGFSYGKRSLKMLGIPAIMNLFELSRKVQNEAHRHIEFIRFSEYPNNILVSRISPHADVLELAAVHFSDRMPSETWIIIDEPRRKAAVHPTEGSCYFTVLSVEEMNAISSLQKTDGFYADLWKTFFHSVSIQERKNPGCQRSFLPLWMRSHMTEFQ